MRKRLSKFPHNPHFWPLKYLKLIGETVRAEGWHDYLYSYKSCEIMEINKANPGCSFQN